MSTLGGVEMSDMHGKTVLVTGATSGIGRATAVRLARMGADVFVHGRTDESAIGAAASIAEEAASPRVRSLSADLSSLSEVRSLAEAVKRSSDRLDVLVANAGTYQPERTISVDGLETTWAVNHLAHFALTLLLSDLLAASAPSRVVTVSSVAHFRGEIDFGDLDAADAYDPYLAYATSKLMQVMFTFEFGERWAGTGVIANALHPGVTDTKLLHAGFPDQQGVSPDVGSDTVVYLASSPEVEDTTAHYFVNQHPAHASPIASDRDVREMLWQVSERLSGVTG